eukprot:351133-Chlamydomonas_euryale.AAC.14
MSSCAHARAWMLCTCSCAGAEQTMWWVAELPVHHARQGPHAAGFEGMMVGQKGSANRERQLAFGVGSPEFKTRTERRHPDVRIACLADDPTVSHPLSPSHTSGAITPAPALDALCHHPTSHLATHLATHPASHPAIHPATHLDRCAELCGQLLPLLLILLVPQPRRLQHLLVLPLQLAAQVLQLVLQGVGLAQPGLHCTQHAHGARRTPILLALLPCMMTLRALHTARVQSEAHADIARAAQRT